ncbi:PD40 domain-containing protein [Pedobacter helvus]|uniref:PD40 domain-containing protein n=1 Tax=Pedobacter helvus TaxID=2563444 RepID=A0ABW9JFT6_9SPHI
MNKLFLIIFCLIPCSLIAQQVELFDENLSRFHNIRDFCITSNGNEAYFTIQSPSQELSQIVVIKKINDKWSEPQLLPFCDEYSYLEPFLSCNGNKLFFASNRPFKDSVQVKKDFDIWYVERKNVNEKWSEPINLGSNVNSKSDEFYPSLSENNNLYFTKESSLGLGKDDLFFCRWDGNKYSAPELLNTNINSDGYEFNAFIAKDESFLLYTKYNAAGGFGSGDLYLARKNSLGEWQKAENIGHKVNTKFMEYCPYYDAENETLYFTSRRDELTTKKFANLAEFQSYISNGANGLSKIYKVKIKF